MENTRRSHRAALGLPVLALVGLALLAAPRVVLHDLGVIQEGTFRNALFVVVPPVVWIAVVVLRRVPNPFLTLLVIGAIYGVLLALGHQLLWDVSFPEGTPRLGGNLGDVPAATGAVVVRSFAAVGSVFTGVLVGAVSGLVAWGISKVVASRR
jgi:hypothetical protein